MLHLHIINVIYSVLYNTVQFQHLITKLDIIALGPEVVCKILQQHEVINNQSNNSRSIDYD